MSNPGQGHTPFVDVSGNVQTAGAKNGAGVDARGYMYATFIVDIGTLGTNATIDFKVQDSADNSTFADITGKAITQQTQAGTDASNSVQKVSVVVGHESERYLRGVLTIGTATSDCGSVGYLSCAKVAPV